MKRCTLDTNIITAFLKNNSRVVERFSEYLEFFDKLTINIISYYEILRGLKDLGNEEKLRSFDNFIQENELVFITKESVDKAAEIYAYLKKDGNLIEDADILMASTAIVEDLVLITNNIKHFRRVKELKLDNWLQN
ncbi:MAG: type II toxin-antitoxin system VapC family toxin [Deltaproteobacteria bacterium]|nr:type II toxin-antitoxin system VapC family toxin [Deltaproteobacteria bacterium]